MNHINEMLQGNACLVVLQIILNDANSINQPCLIESAAGNRRSSDFGKCTLYENANLCQRLANQRFRFIHGV